MATKPSRPSGHDSANMRPAFCPWASSHLYPHQGKHMHARTGGGREFLVHVSWAGRVHQSTRPRTRVASIRPCIEAPGHAPYQSSRRRTIYRSTRSRTAPEQQASDHGSQHQPTHHSSRHRTIHQTTDMEASLGAEGRAAREAEASPGAEDGVVWKWRPHGGAEGRAASNSASGPLHGAS